MTFLGKISYLELLTLPPQNSLIFFHLITVKLNYDLWITKITNLSRDLFQHKHIEEILIPENILKLSMSCFENQTDLKKNHL